MEENKKEISLQIQQPLFQTQQNNKDDEVFNEFDEEEIQQQIYLTNFYNQQQQLKNQQKQKQQVQNKQQGINNTNNEEEEEEEDEDSQYLRMLQQQLFVSQQQQQQAQAQQIQQPQDEEANIQNNADQVQQNIQNEIRNRLNSSVKTNIFYLIISVGKIVSSLVLLTSPKYNKECAPSLSLFLIFMLVHDFINASYMLISICMSLSMMRRGGEELINLNLQNQNYYQQQLQNELEQQGAYNDFNYQQQQQQIQQQQQEDEFLIEKKCVSLQWTRELNNIYFFLLFIWGHVDLFFSDTNCDSQAPALYALTFLYIIFGYLFIFYPILLLICFCLCMPVIIFIAYYFGRNTQEPITKKIIKQLKVRKYEKENTTEDECLICRVEYKKNDKIIDLPCNIKHYFHADCIKTWLKINGVCPICRVKIGEKLDQLKNLEKQKQEQQKDKNSPEQQQQQQQQQIQQQ